MLGTTISLQLAQKMGGRIEVRSEIGKGSTFKVYLPLQHAPIEALPNHVPPNVESLTTVVLPLTILVADDDLINLEIISIQLHNLGHHIYTACNGKDVINIWQCNDIDLILMDVQMPVMDGISTCKFIRQSNTNHKHTIPIIALTAGVFQEDRDKAEAAGMNGFATKPIDIIQLQNEINRVMNDLME